MINTGRGIGLGSFTDIPPRTLLEWRNDYVIWKWCRQNTILSFDKHCQWLDGLRDIKDVMMFGIYSGHEPIGACGLTSIDRLNSRAEFSLYIAPDFQKRGYAKAALETLMDHAFGQQNLNSVWGESFDTNPAMEMFKKLGFKHEGIRRDFYYRDGKYLDAHLFSILKSEWALKLPL